MRPATPPEGRGPLQLLTDRTFGPFFAAKVLSGTAMWIYSVAAAIVVWELTRSTLLVGAVGIAQFLPLMVLGLWMGSRADRGDRRSQLVAGWALTAAGAFALSAWAFVGGLSGSTGAVGVIAATAAVGIGHAISSPAMNALLPALVPPRDLASAVAMNSVPMTIGRAIGPVVGAVLLVRSGPAAAFGAAGIGCVAFAVVAAVVPIRKVERPVGADTSVLAGLRYVRAQPSLIVLLLGVVAIGIGTDPVMTLAPALADTLGRASTFVGTLASAFGIGAGIGFVMIAQAQRRLGISRVGATGLAMVAVSHAVTAVSPWPTVTLVTMFLAGVGFSQALASLTTMIQQRVAEDLRGRVMALWSVGFLGSRPLAAGLGGVLADTIGVRAAFMVIAILLVVGTWQIRPSRVA